MEPMIACACGCGQDIPVRDKKGRPHYFVSGHSGRIPLHDPIRFWGNVDKNGPVIRPEIGPCWIWTAATTYGGYGTIRKGPKNYRAHRVGYEIQIEPIIGNWDVCHVCDNPPCVRGSHLFLSTAAGNAQDMAAKGRGAFQVRPESAPRGERNGNAKLTSTAVLEIRRLAITGITQSQLAQEYGVVQTTINAIVRRQIWKHV